MADPAALTARFIAYAGSEDPDTLLSALIAQFTLVDLGITAERATEVDVVYRGAAGLVLGCELLAWDDVVDDACVTALLDYADRVDALTAGILTRNRIGEIVVAGQRLTLKPLALEAVRVDRSAAR